ncbi:alpha-1,3-mannosyltransferase CMT1 [Xylariales sp. AK1849]|nr:alpha-1,3-mannosyltransferase CMT1 [Xylariales sp. AK1849]
MMRRSRFVTLQVLCLLFVATSILVGYATLYSPSRSQWRQLLFHPTRTGVSETPKQEAEHSTDLARVGDPNLYESGAVYRNAILDPEDTSLPRLACPTPDLTRYDYLAAGIDGHNGRLKYFFALDLRQTVKVLPRLIGSILEAVRFLGPAVCALSVVEGNSDDGTFEVLDSLRSEMEEMGLTYFLQSSDIDPKTGERIGKLAELRNLALAPLNSTLSDPDAGTTIIFLNDVALCMTDILELIHQRAFQSADMTCAMDWTYGGENPTFYDVWIARTMKGDSFFNIPSDGSWDYAWDLFWDDVGTKMRFNQKLPFQVFACWNGAVAFGAGPILGLPERSNQNRQKNGTELKKVAFRAPNEQECYVGEPTLFCMDLWWAGYSRIAVVPSVNLEYSDGAATRIKKLKGYTSKWTGDEDEAAMRISWVDEPPEKVKCIPGWDHQHWRYWNETLS